MIGGNLFTRATRFTSKHPFHNIQSKQSRANNPVRNICINPEVSKNLCCIVIAVAFVEISVLLLRFMEGLWGCRSGGYEWK